MSMIIGSIRKIVCCYPKTKSLLAKKFVRLFNESDFLVSPYIIILRSDKKKAEFLTLFWQRAFQIKEN